MDFIKAKGKRGKQEQETRVLTLSAYEMESPTIPPVRWSRPITAKRAANMTRALPTNSSLMASHLWGHAVQGQGHAGSRCACLTRRTIEIFAKDLSRKTHVLNIYT